MHPGTPTIGADNRTDHRSNPRPGHDRLITCDDCHHLASQCSQLTQRQFIENPLFVGKILIERADAYTGQFGDMVGGKSLDAVPLQDAP